MIKYNRYDFRDDSDRRSCLTKADIKRGELYKEWYNKGYIFKTNVEDKNIERYSEDYKNQGLDVQVVEPAVTSAGDILSNNWKTILVRKPKK